MQKPAHRVLAILERPSLRALVRSAVRPRFKLVAILTTVFMLTIGGSATHAQVIVDDGFDSYADTAAFSAVWTPIGTDPSFPGALVTDAEALNSYPNSIYVPGTTTNGQYRNRKSFTETSTYSANGNLSIGDNIVWQFNFYDSNASGNPQRNYANLQDTTSPSLINQLVSLGLNNNRLATDDGGNYLMARILGYTPPGQSSGDFFKLNDPEAIGRTSGWNYLSVEIGTSDGLHTDYRFYVGNQLAKTILGVGNATQIRSFDNITIGSGLGNANTSAYFDNMYLEYRPWDYELKLDGSIINNGSNLDFGTVLKDDTNPLVTFSIKNTGSATLNLSSFLANSPFNVISAPSTLAPAASANIVVDMGTVNVAAFNQTLSSTTNLPNSSPNKNFGMNLLGKVLAHAAVTSTWDGTNNNWTQSNHWSSPNYPNNGNGAATYDAVVNSGTVTLNQDITIQSLTLSGGTITGSNNLNLQGMIKWTGGTFSGSGVTTIADGKISGPSTKTLNNRTLRIAGNVIWSEGEILPTSIANIGTLVVQNGATFNAKATTNKNLRVNLQVDNGGRFVSSGSRATFVSDSSNPAGTVTNNGIIEVSQHGALFLPGGSGNGTFIVRDEGFLLFEVANASEMNYTGNIILENGFVDVLAHSGPQLPLQMDSFGTGTFKMNGGTLINSNEISPGNPLGENIGVVTVEGNYEQTPAGQLTIELEGTADNQIDKLEVTGTATLGGKLQIVASSAIVPHMTFTILRASSFADDTFDTIESTGNPNVHFTVQSSGLFLTLESERSGDMDGIDGFTLADVDLFVYALMNDYFKFSDKCDCNGRFPADGGDFNGNGRVDFGDLSDFRGRMADLNIPSSALAAAFERYASVPEPMSALLMVIIGSFLAINRRRRCGVR